MYINLLFIQLQTGIFMLSVNYMFCMSNFLFISDAVWPFEVSLLLLLHSTINLSHSISMSIVILSVLTYHVTGEGFNSLYKL